MDGSFEVIASICGIVAIICQLLLIIGLVRNIIVRKSFVGWVFPDGTTKREKIYFAVTFSLMLLFAAAGAFLPRNE